MRIVQANAVYDRSAKTPDELLDLYRTLTEWSVAVARAGADVSVVQRFHAAATVERDGIRYTFVTDKEQPWLSTQAAPAAFIDAIVKENADVVHVNGLIFPAVIGAIRARSPKAAIVAQHHGGDFPIRSTGLFGYWHRQRWKGGLAAVDALSFTSAEQAEPWRAAGVVGEQRIIEIIEASTAMRLVTRERARTAINADGSPLILWVGRLTTNKDPLTVLDGLDRALPQMPGAKVLMVFGDNTMIEQVDERVRGSAILRDRVILAGSVSHDEMPNYYGAADVFISGSHSEGSGYAVIEAMAAGVVPIVTDIPSFRVITGDEFRRWRAGDADGFARALLETCAGDLEPLKAAAKSRFDRALSWDALAAKTVSEYRALITR